MLKHTIRWILIAAAGCFIAAIPAAAASCESLASLKLPDGKITSAEVVAAGAFAPPGPGGILAGGPGGNAGFRNAPAFCRIAATLTPSTDSDFKIEVWMPVENWNGKLVGTGNGVWAGSISYSALAEPLAKGYAAMATDGGHVGNGMSAAFAAGHPEKLIDFGHRAVHEMTVKAKTFIEAFYGKKEQRSLWVSCSTGGRQGLMASYRYPGDFHGISSMAPANPMVDLMIGSMQANYAATKEPDRRLTMQQLTIANRAYIAECDEKDGVKDGIVSDPNGCKFDPASIVCKEGASGDCLTAGQAAALRDIYEGARNARTGEKVYAGFEPGSEQQLNMLVLGNEPFAAASSFFKDLVFADQTWDYKTFDYDKDIDRARKLASAIIDVPADGPVKFLEGGGKLLLSHGWADGLIPARSTVDFYESLTANLKNDKLKDSVQLFMMPGVGHCSGGDGPSVVDMLAEIDQWVETGKKPERIIASRPAAPAKPAAKTAQTQTQPQAQPKSQPMTRPLCPWPQVAVYKGSGSTDDAANFECRAK